MTSDETSFSLLKSIIAEDVDTYVDLRKYIENCGKIPKKNLLINPFVLPQ